MPKDTTDKRYLNPGIPRTSRLMQRLEQVYAETGVAESQMLVYYASEYVRLVIDGAGVVPVAPAPPALVVSTVPTSKETTQTQGNIRTLESMNTTEPNFDSFGDPDE